MAVTYFDTDKTKEISKKIINYANQYEVIINKLFKRMTEVPYVTGEWIGDSAKKYAKAIALDKDEFINFGKMLKSYGTKISKDSDAMKDKIDATNKQEEKKE